MRLKHILKTITQLGITQVSLFALYKLGLKTGYYKHISTPNSQRPIPNIEYLFTLPSREKLLALLGEDGIKTLLSKADQIVDGYFPIFGGDLAEIKLNFNHPLVHWTDYESGRVRVEYAPPLPQDIKYLWEPARFGWAFTLGRAYRASGDEKYAKSFWRYFEIFDAGNPPNMGPNWMSGQEVAIRLMAFVWVGQVFSNSAESTRQRKERLAQSIAEHASRIPLTLLYARAQNNNHLTSEAAGLYTAALALPDHPQAKKWKKLGIKWLNWSFENQIDENGEYIQHSVTYHRLMLQLALWVTSVTMGEKVAGANRSVVYLPAWISYIAMMNLSLATRWLTGLTDPISGNAPNLGANDGAYLFPLSNGNFRDFRSVVTAASRAFLNKNIFDAGLWDEMSLWFNVESSKLKEKEPSNLATFQPLTFNLQPSPDTWASLRVADGNLRLAHADQLHLDLWWMGENITLDPGTYLYNGEKPWDNPLSATEFHNTVTVNGLDQMTRTSKFMYLDWSRGRIIERSDSQIVAEHDGYKKLGVIHRRSVKFAENTWLIEDNLQPSTFNLSTYRLHWLFPDWEYELENRDERIEIRLKSPHGQIKIVQYAPLRQNSGQARNTHSNFSLARAGKLLYGDTKIPPTRGWYSPTYGVKIPALSLALEVSLSNEVKFISKFEFPQP